MSIYAVIDESEPEFFSSNSGWTDVLDWSETLEDSEFVSLCDEGFTEDVSACLESMTAAVEILPPPKTVAETISELAYLMSTGGDVLMITNGMQDDEQPKRDKNNIRIM